VSATDPAKRVNVWEGYATGASGDPEVERAFLRQLGKVYETFCRKQRDYGRGNIAKFGAPGVLVRLSDKVERIANLVRRGGEPANEGLDDSWLDAATYGVIGMMCRAGDWPGSPEASPSRPEGTE
jgi:hypothetical protein